MRNELRRQPPNYPDLTNKWSTRTSSVGGEEDI
jgi:hypothetical protein